MPMLACGRWECDDAEMVEIMGGHYPPEDEKSKAAYFKMFEHLVRSKYTEKAVGDMYLLGTGPSLFMDWIS